MSSFETSINFRASSHFFLLNSPTTKKLIEGKETVPDIKQKYRLQILEIGFPVVNPHNFYKAPHAKAKQKINTWWNSAANLNAFNESFPSVNVTAAMTNLPQFQLKPW